ncbi:uncharacterized protein DNG_02561 [Cephalotrichum gorgonifer]|uniref:Zn(2)-C6 fungal-type domain-containing protein n=1 Tax=Cephalotrichum gorgonifer TaxID=2041049 RepID=A0AAE8SSS3_9PEZI|nr:uncharacterized protein DNG_02561 [Cephalotrichum gorgonifer]
MGPTAAVHPTQRRFSCQVCRKHKSRCRRLHISDPKCARCMLLGIECLAGEQRRVGRPRRRGAASADETRQTSDNPSSTLIIPPPTPGEGRHNQPKPPRISHEGPSFVEGRNQPYWSSTPVPVLPTAAEDAFITAQTRPVAGAGSFDQDPIPWESSDLYQIFSLSNTDSGFGISGTLNTPLMNSLPIDNMYYTPTEPLSIPMPEPSQVPANGIATSDAFTKLSKINLDVHLRVAAVERERANLDFNSFVYREGPLYIDSSTFAEFMLRESQEFALILNRLLTPLALTLTSIFTQLISLYELMLEHLAARIKRVAIEPVDPFPGLIFGGLSVAEPCVQGMLFSEVVILQLERIEQALGVSAAVPESSEVGLLSSRQKDVLWSELDGGLGIIAGHGMTRPAMVRKRFKKVSFDLKQISLSNTH